MLTGKFTRLVTTPKLEQERRGEVIEARLTIAEISEGLERRKRRGKRTDRREGTKKKTLAR